MRKVEYHVHRSPLLDPILSHMNVHRPILYLSNFNITFYYMYGSLVVSFILTFPPKFCVHSYSLCLLHAHPISSSSTWAFQLYLAKCAVMKLFLMQSYVTSCHSISLGPNILLTNLSSLWITGFVDFVHRSELKIPWLRLALSKGHNREGVFAPSPEVGTKPSFRNVVLCGSVVVKTLCYKPEGLGFEIRWDECIFIFNLPNSAGRTRPCGLLSL
jgi:hypothetical protein